MTAGVTVAGALAGGSLGIGAAALAVAVRAGAAARSERLAARLVRERERGTIEAARRLAIAASASVEAVYAEIERSARRAAAAVDGVLVFERRDDALRCVHAGGSRFAYFDGSEIALDDAGALPVRSLRDGHRISLAAGGVRPLHPRDVDAIAFPLAVGSGRATVLAVAARAPLDRGCVERLAALADTAAPALQIALDRDDDRRHAEYDGLTGLLRPIAFRTRLAALVERARFVRGARLALVFVDSDRFKEWNDAFGHAAGDALLRALAAVLRSTADGEDDLAARNGGDEFCLVFAGAGKADAIERAEVLRARIAEAGRSACESRGAPALAVTASIGVAAYPADAADANALLECADAAMYHSKRSGRDGVSYRAPRGDGFVRLG